MILMQYTKTDGAEYLSHLDLLRHIDRILRRAHIPVVKSEAVNRHPRIFLSAPLGVGIRSLAEYALVDTPFTGDFTACFNQYAPNGIRCVKSVVTDRMVGVASEITFCEYAIEGILPFDPDAVLAEQTLVLTDKRGRTKDVRDRIREIFWEGSTLHAVLAAGENNLRPDVFAEYAAARFGGAVKSILKLAAFGIQV